MATRLEMLRPSAGFWKGFFLVAALYDLILGASFFFLYGPIFNLLTIMPPNNTSYIHITAGYVFVQGVGYWLVYRDMLANLGIVKVGVVYKAIYIAVAVYYLATGALLDTVFAWFAVFDFAFMLMFLRFLVLAQRR